ncbi:hypothetical protein VHP8226_02840 [Vibrio hippocampi]|uniref:Right handed beta helix domain-containing protein n=2 Tax=Vibrio hippocampi TaxID=654686 RepID=A0ABN8DP23_9VIBR|nr:hypothetical protein VHP8226_02840 [Vibrio hippocampi]
MKMNKLAAVLPITLYSVYGLAAPGYEQGAALPTQFQNTIYAVDHGVIANDSSDDSVALQAIIDNQVSASNNQNTVIILPKGEINLNDEIHIDKSGVVIKGAGSDPETGTKIVVTSWSPYDVDASNAPDFDKKYWPGFGVFRVETREKHPNEQDYEGSANFHWKHSIEFGQAAKMGDTTLTLESGKAREFSQGDLIYVGAASDEAFLDKGEVPQSRRNASHIKTGHMRTQIFKVASVNSSNNTVTLDKPLEFDVPLNNESGYNSRVMPVKAIENFGLQDFYLTMDTKGSHCEAYNRNRVSDSNPNGVLYRYENVCAQDAIHGIILKWVYNGWVDNVQVDMIGSHPIVTEFAKNITISNNQVDGSWNKGAGGNGYIRGSKLYNSWIHHNDIRNIRHLALQWSATGNIVENNTLNVDMNLHGGWERNNLIRSNRIEVPFEHRSWSNGAPESGATWQPIWVGSGDHASKWSGPTGPNNVLVDNTLKKATSSGANIVRWGLFDEPSVEYALNWDGTTYKHLNINGEPISTWNQNLAEGVYQQIPNSGVTVSGGSWPPEEGEPEDPEPVDPPVSSDCGTTAQYVWSSKMEIDLSQAECITLDNDLKGKTVQIWDSDTNDSCDFRGTLVSVDGAGSVNVSSNYVSSTAMMGSIIKFSPNNNCQYVKFRAY